MTSHDAGCSGSGPSLPIPAAGDCMVPMPRCRPSWKRVSPSCIARTTSASLLSLACVCGPSDMLLHEAVCTSWILVAECSGFALFVNHLVLFTHLPTSFLESHFGAKIFQASQVSWHSTHSLLVSGLNHWQEINWCIDLHGERARSSHKQYDDGSTSTVTHRRRRCSVARADGDRLPSRSRPSACPEQLLKQWYFTRFP